jgi:hypothetical protein
MLSELSVLQVVCYLIGLPIGIFLVLTFKRYSRGNHKTLKNCAINVALGPLRYFRVGPYSYGDRMVQDIEISMKYAMKKTKLTDFGGSQFSEAYKRIMTSEEQKKERYSNLGYISAKIELSMGWVRRLKLVDYMKRNADVATVPVRSPVFVMGLPRTGTTFLHRLLSLDPAVRAPITWELLAPVPTPKGDEDQTVQDSDRAKRAKYIKKLIATRKSMGDHALERIHEIGYDLPEECLLGLSDELPILVQYFRSSYMHIQTLLGEDATGAYRYYKQVLQLLSYQIGERTDPRRWTLKCPVHLFYPRQIGAVFPDAKFVWTHRHPKNAVPSLCSLVEAAHSVYYEPETMDVAALGGKIRDVSAELLTKAPADIAASGCENANVLYTDLIKDPLSVVRDIYKQFGWEFTNKYEDILKTHIAADKKKREELKAAAGGGGGAVLHDYSPEKFSLTTEELSSGPFAEYMEKFNLLAPA